jgi:cytochrome c553
MIDHASAPIHSARLCGRRAWLLATCLTLASLADAQGDANLELRSLAASCAACHGTDGHSKAKAQLPSLAHLPTTYFMARMYAFREDDKLAASVMAQIAKGYDDHQLQQLAEYFASQPRT